VLRSAVGGNWRRQCAGLVANRRLVYRRAVDMDAESKAIEAASANIRAEAQSGDKWTSRARPTFLYLFYVILAINFILVPISQMIKGMSLEKLHPI
jgi:hypothetical protein